MKIHAKHSGIGRTPFNLGEAVRADSLHWKTVAGTHGKYFYNKDVILTGDELHRGMIRYVKALMGKKWR